MDHPAEGRFGYTKQGEGIILMQDAVDRETGQFLGNKQKAWDELPAKNIIRITLLKFFSNIEVHVRKQIILKE